MAQRLGDRRHATIGEELDAVRRANLIDRLPAMSERFERARLFGRRAIDALGPFAAGRAKGALVEAVEFAIQRAY